MSVISMKQLLEAGVHFGHQTRRWNPKMAPYIYTERNGIYIIDLQKSVGKVDEAYNFISDVVSGGGTVLFVGTKKQAQDSIEAEAQRCGMFYVNERWLGGMLTNFKTIRSRVDRLKELERMEEDGTFDVLPKKEVISLRKEMDKLNRNLGGVREMSRLPDAIFVVDPKKERNCVLEAHILGIPLIGIADTNCDPEELDYVIPGNDDAIRSVKLIASTMADAVIEGKQGLVEVDTAQENYDELGNYVAPDEFYEEEIAKENAGEEAAVEDASGETAKEKAKEETVEETVEEAAEEAASEEIIEAEAEEEAVKEAVEAEVGEEAIEENVEGEILEEASEETTENEAIEDAMEEAAEEAVEEEIAEEDIAEAAEEASEE